MVDHPTRLADAPTPAGTGTLPDLFQAALARHPDKPAIRYIDPIPGPTSGPTPGPSADHDIDHDDDHEDDQGRDGSGTDNLHGSPWRSITYAAFGRQVRDAALGLQALGIEAGDRVGILSLNRPAWAVCDYAMLHAGAIPAPVYDTLTPDQIAYILNDAGVRACFVQDAGVLATVRSVADQVPSMDHLVVMDDVPTDARAEHVLTLAELQERGRALHERDPGAFEARWTSVAPEDTATLIYTSGTTGNPKGVMLSHDNIRSNILCGIDILDIGPHDHYLSFLPLSHSFERVLGNFAQYTAGTTVWFARGIDTLVEDLQQCRPTVLISVPRLYEKVRQGVLDKVSRAPARRQRLFHWATGVGAGLFQHVQDGTEPPRSLRLRHGLADRLVLARVRKALGMDRLRFAGSGAAALNPDVARFFGSIGVLLLEGYGMTELSPVVSVNLPDDNAVGTVGRPIPGVEVRIDHEGWEGKPGEGEILVRGPNVMQGYWQLPEETAETITGDGWLHTGDVGMLGDDGRLRITDRKKELFKTAYGKYIAPQRVETLLVADPLVAEAVCIGADRKYVAALLVPDLDKLGAWADENGLPSKDRAGLVDHPEVRARFAAVVERANRDLARYEQVKRFAVLSHAFEVGRELTPSMKVKRRVVDERYADAIEELYADA